MATTKIIKLCRIKLVISAFILFVLIFFTQCGNNYYYNSTIDIPEEGWSSKKAAIFETNIKDSLQNFNIIFQLGNTNEYRYSNIWFFVKTISPSGAAHKDTLEYILSKKTGEWVGKKDGNAWISKMYFKNGVRFPEKGNYKFEIWQAMRSEKLKGITRMGIMFEEL